jgi:sugar lactone lactonase YvrE
MTVIALLGFCAPQVSGQGLNAAKHKYPRVGPVQPVINFDIGNDFTEGLAISNRGNVYVGIAFSGRIMRIDSRGVASEVTNIDPTEESIILLGLAVDERENVYAAVWGFAEGLTGVWKVQPDGTAELYAAMPLGSIPNAMVFDILGNLYVTDSSAGAVWRIARGSREAKIWAQDDLLGGPNFGANGIALYGNDIYVINFDMGRIVSIPIHWNRSAGAPRVYVEDSRIVNGDGIAFDIFGNAYVGVQGPSSSIVRVSPDREVETIVTFPDDLPYATNPVFGMRGERTTIYVTIDGSWDLVKVDVGVPGYPVFKR